MYKLLIADDEITIREGIRDIIDWNGIGFEVCGIFEDGRDVLDFLGTHEADAIITDIKMTFKSGIDIAQYIYENRLSTKILFVSGYNEVELAMSAIKYNVNDYILKPVDIDLLTGVMIKIKEELDREKNVFLQKNILEQYEKNIEEIKDIFFGELVKGGITNEAFIRSIFQLIYKSLDFDDCCCFSLVLELEDFGNYMQNHWDKTSNDFYKCLSSCITIASAEVQYRLISKKQNELQLIGIVTVSQDNGYLNKTIIENGTEQLCRDIMDLFKLSLHIRRLDIYRGIPQLLIQSAPHLKPSFSMDELLSQLDEQQKIIYSDMRLGNSDAVKSAVVKLISSIETLNMATARILVENLCLTIKSKLTEFNREVGDSFDLEGFFKRLPQIERFDALEDELLKLLEGSMCQLLTKEQDIIEQAKRYIGEHIMEDISLENISEKFYLSQYYFSRMFKAKTGETLINYIIRIKIEKAMSLLKSSQYKVYEICNMVGYKNNHYFTKVFKSYTGYTPNAYRNLTSSLE